MDGTAADQVNRRCRITGSLLDVQETLHTNRLYVHELMAAYEFANTTPLTTELPFVTAEDLQESMKELSMHQRLMKLQF